MENKFNTTRIFITGIAGFIGYHLATFLKKRGDFVMGCDNFNPYYDPKLKWARAKNLQESGIEVVEADIVHLEMIEKKIQENNITHFVHLAAQAGVRHCIEHPQAYVHSNLNGFVQILELIRRHPHIKLIYASSSSVYGSNPKIPFAESDPTDAPCSLYGATKKANEVLARSYHSLYGLSVTGLRYFTVYGPWGRPDMAYFSFAQAISEGRPIPLYNRGQMQRDFTYIDDIVRGTASALDLGAPCEIFNLGNHQPQDLLYLVELLQENLGKKADLRFLPMQLGDVLTTCADISKSHAQLQFSPTTTLSEGIKKFTEWYQAIGKGG